MISLKVTLVKFRSMVAPAVAACILFGCSGEQSSTPGEGAAKTTTATTRAEEKQPAAIGGKGNLMDGIPKKDR